MVKRDDKIYLPNQSEEELPDITPYIKHIEIDTDEDEELIDFSDVDYDHDST